MIWACQDRAVIRPSNINARPAAAIPAPALTARRPRTCSGPAGGARVLRCGVRPLPPPTYVFGTGSGGPADALPDQSLDHPDIRKDAAESDGQHPARPHGAVILAVGQLGRNGSGVALCRAPRASRFLWPIRTLTAL